ncbi:hypothetical protein SB773_26145 [Bacillus sp. SIMBA_074]|uniref:hypothetical protein n=1 Tax=Bacillus sp. SIMBA_074 TaxID=3085812 RepID=UPI0039780550
MANRTFADFLNEKGYKAFYIEPEDGDNFVKGEAISINDEQFLISDIHKTHYWEEYRKYLNRLKE